VVGLGQPAAGDDAVGHAVVAELARRLQARNRQEQAVLHRFTDGTGLVELLDGRPLLVVDAAVGAAPPGTLLEPDLDELAGVPLVSTHGIGLLEAVGLARALEGDGATRGLRVVAVSIDAPRGMAHGLSEPVAAAVAPTVARIEAWIDAQLRAPMQATTDARIPGQQEVRDA